MAKTTEVAEVAVEDTRSRLRLSLYGLGTALAFATSPVFIRLGLEGLPSPLLGLTVGMVVCVAVYALLLLARGSRSDSPWRTIPRSVKILQVLAGTFVGLSTWARWVALDLAPVGVVIALGRVNVPVLLLLAPIFLGGRLEKVTPTVWLGGILIIVGSLILIFTG